MDIGLCFKRFAALLLALALCLFAGFAEELPDDGTTGEALITAEDDVSEEDPQEAPVTTKDDGSEEEPWEAPVTTEDDGSEEEPWETVEISVDWLNTEFVYDGETHQPMAAYPGMIIRVVGGGTEAGTYLAEAVAEDGYEITNPVCAFTIHRAPITVDWDDTEFVYDGQLHMPTATCPGIHVRVLGTALNAGSYIAYADAGRNYEIDNRACPFVIAPRPVEIELTYAKRMGEPDPAFVLTPENLLIDDMDAQAVLDELTLPKIKNLTLQRLPGEQVGEYEYDPTALNAENYPLIFTHPFEITR